jgi:phosphohistidine phosphatase
MSVHEQETAASVIARPGADRRYHRVIPTSGGLMELILWRHAEAEEGPTDLERALTPRGVRQASRVGRWLKERLRGDWRVITSPALRTRQTAAGLGLPVEIVASIAPGADAAAVLAACRWPLGPDNIIVVGHQPTLGQVAAGLLAGTEGDVTLRKGGAWWFRANAPAVAGGLGTTRLRAVIGPDTVR